MDINNLISQYGYAALVIGSVAEGETITLLGGVAAHQGLLKFWLVVISVALGDDWRSAALFTRQTLWRTDSAAIRTPEKADPKGPADDPASPLPVCHRHPLYVRLSGYRPAADWRQPPTAEGVSAAEYCRRDYLGVNFTTLGYLGGEAIGPWLHHLDAHLKHWIWLILAVVLVVAAHWWLKRREAKKKE